MNGIGWLIPLRSPDLEQSGSSFKGGVSLSADTVRDRVDAACGEGPECLRVATRAVFEGVVHAWDDKDLDRFRLRISPWENLWLYVFSFVKPVHYRKYEYCDPAKALERGVGLCSEFAIILVGLLNERGVPARIRKLDGHVVAEAESATGIWWTLDANLGVVIEHDLAEIERTPALIRPYYATMGYAAKRIDNLVRLYGSEGNEPPLSVVGYCSPKKMFIEDAAYVIKWGLPFLLLGVGFLPDRRKKHIRG